MRHYANFTPDTSLSSSIAGGDTSIDVGSQTDFPPASYTIVIFEGGDTPRAASTKEMLEVTAVSGTTLTIKRDIDGFNGSGQSFTTSATVRHVLGADQLQENQPRVPYPEDPTGSLAMPGVLAPRTNASQPNTFKPTQGQIEFLPVSVERGRLGDPVVGIGTAGSSDGTTQAALFGPTRSLPSLSNLITTLPSRTLDTTGPKSFDTSSVSAKTSGIYWVGILNTGYSTVPEFYEIFQKSQNLWVPTVDFNAIFNFASSAPSRIKSQGTSNSDFSSFTAEYVNGKGILYGMSF